MRDNLFRILGVVVMLAGVTACGDDPADELIGTWTLEMSGLRLTGDGSFAVTAMTGVDGLSEPDAEGTYTATDTQIELIDTEGPFACPEEQVGVFDYTVSDTSLTLDVVDDPCDGRSGALVRGTWTRFE